MKRLCCLAAALLALAIALPDSGIAQKKDEAQPENGFVPMFNGKDLTGWVNVNCAPSTFYVKDNQIITTGKPTGYLRTEKQYENFIAEFDWMHVPPAPGEVGNSGFFVWADPIPAVGTGYTRGIEVQVLVNLEWKDKNTGKSTATSQGDLFSIWGAKCEPDWPHPLGWERCIPKENRAKGENEWNHYRVEANDGVIKLAVNGKVVSGVSKCSPRKGYLALESEGSECRFKNLKIKELPSTNPKPSEICDVAQGHRPLYTGLDLSGWKADGDAKKHWQVKDTVLHFDGKGKALLTSASFADVEFILDFRFPDKGAKKCEFFLRKTDHTTAAIMFDREHLARVWGGDTGIGWQIDSLEKLPLKPAGQWNRLQVTSDKFNPGQLTISVNGKSLDLGKRHVSKTGAIGISADGPMDFANLFVRELKK